ncbi:MAG: twin-arginine translocase subunit TatB [bacterium]|nr:MAG: twin-arginine translocase subunit TatB [bacterium]
MLGIGMQEILVILVVALIVIGPRRLPELAKTLGKGLAEFKKAADDLQETVRTDLERERHEEFRKKYPHLIPDEGEEEEGQPRSPGPPGGGPPAGSGTEVSGQEAEPQPSYNPEEIEGGDVTHDDKADG